MGPVNHSRWLTLALRVVMYYMTQAKPSNAITRLASFVINHYAPLWFELRQRWRVTDAPAVLFRAYKRMVKPKALTNKELKVVKEVFERGFFWSHPENLLLACLADPARAVREKAVER